MLVALQLYEYTNLPQIITTEKDKFDLHFTFNAFYDLKKKFWKNLLKTINNMRVPCNLLRYVCLTHWY